MTPGPGKRWFPAGRISASLHSFYSVTTRTVQLAICCVPHTLRCAACLWPQNTLCAAAAPPRAAQRGRAPCAAPPCRAIGEHCDFYLPLKPALFPCDTVLPVHSLALDGMHATRTTTHLHHNIILYEYPVLLYPIFLSSYLINSLRELLYLYRGRKGPGRVWLYTF